MNQTKKPKKGLIIAVVVILILVLVGFGVYLNQKTSDAQDISTNIPATSTDPVNTIPVTTNPADTNKTTTPKTPTASSVYKDGTYSADGSYVSPGGHQMVAVTLVLKDDVVTSLNVTSLAADPHSASYQDRFISGVNQYVVGKNIDEVNVSRVSGSSLTSRGFMQALASIKAEAKA